MGKGAGRKYLKIKGVNADPDIAPFMSDPLLRENLRKCHDCKTVWTYNYRCVHCRKEWQRKNHVAVHSEYDYSDMDLDFRL